MEITNSHADTCRQYVRQKFALRSAEVEAYITNVEALEGSAYWQHIDPDPAQGDFRDELDEDFESYLDQTRA